MIQPGEARLRRSHDIGRADWIRDRLVGFALGVHSVVPGGFPAYIRVLHPVEGPPPERRLVRWAEVAERAGVAMHASIDFDELAAALDGTPDSKWRDLSEPWTGSLDPEPLAALCDVLARHTATPAACWFGIWDGNGWLHPDSGIVMTFTSDAAAEDRDGIARPLLTEPGSHVTGLTWDAPAQAVPLFELPWREYRLLSGPLDAALEVGSVLNGVFFPESPNLIWPDDRAWCVATEVDLASTYIAGPQALADDLLADPRLDAWAVAADDPLS